MMVGLEQVVDRYFQDCKYVLDYSISLSHYSPFQTFFLFLSYQNYATTWSNTTTYYSTGDLIAKSETTSSSLNNLLPF